MNDHELLSKFFSIFNEYQSRKRRSIGEKKYETWFHKKFVETDLMRPDCEKWIWAGADWDKRQYVSLDSSQLARYEEHSKDYFKSERVSVAVRKDFVIKVLTLGCVVS